MELLIGNYEKRFAAESEDGKYSLEFLKALIHRLQTLSEQTTTFMTEKSRVRDRYSWQKEGDKFVNPNVTKAMEKACNQWIDKSTKEFNQSE